MKNTVSIAILIIAMILASVPVMVIPEIAMADEGDIDTTLDVFGNADEDMTIDEQDVTSIENMIIETNTTTDLADANYDGNVNMLDVTQTELIILGEDKEITIIDTAERIVTVEKPLKTVVTPYSGNVETLRSLKAQDMIVATGSSIDDIFTAGLNDPADIGSMWDPDVETILGLNPDLVILHAGTSSSTWDAKLTEANDVLVSAGINVLRINTNQSDIYLEEVAKLGYALGKAKEAQALIDFYNGIYDLVEERIAGISEDQKPNVYVESKTAYSITSYTYIEETGGVNLFSDMSGTIDAEAVIDGNPDFILKFCYTNTDGSYIESYDLDTSDTEELKKIRDEIMSRDELKNVTAVKEGKVYVMTTTILGTMPRSGCRHFLQRIYQAKWFYPNLFEDVDPIALHQEYLTDFQCTSIDLSEKGVFVYP